MHGTSTSTSTASTPWIGDLFAACWDRLSQGDVNRLITSSEREKRHPADDWLRERLFASSDGCAPVEVMRWLAGAACDEAGIDAEPDEALRWFVAGRAIDALLADIRPFAWRADDTLSRGLLCLQARYTRMGSYGRDARGVVVPRGPIGPFAPRIDPGVAPDPSSGNHKAQLFNWLTRSTDPALAVGPPAGRDGPAIDLDRAPITVAVVPWAEDAQYLDMRSELVETIPWVHVDVPARSEVDLDARATAVVAALADRGVAVAVLPEFVVSPAAVAALRQALKQATAERDDLALELVVAGSGLSVERDAYTGFAYNESVVLSRRGQVLWRQRKCHQYAMEPDRMRSYRLDPAICATSRHREGFHPGERIEVRDTALGRSVVLICEDLAQPQPGRGVLDALRPDWLFVPVLDGELIFGRWIHQHALPIARDFATHCVVATSLVLPLREAPERAAFGVGLCVSGPFPTVCPDTGDLIRGNPGCAQVMTVQGADPMPRVATLTWAPETWAPTWLTEGKPARPL